MSLLIGCPACGAQFKAPERLAGRTVRCLKCNASIVVSPNPIPADPPAPAPPAPAPLPFAEPLPIPAERSAAGLTALLLTGLGLAFLLVVAVLVILLNRTVSPVLVENAPENHSTEEKTNNGPLNPAETEQKPAPAELTYAERLTELEAQEQDALAPLEKQHAVNKEIMQRLRKEEDEIFKKSKFPGKAAARYATLLKDSAFAVRQINKDSLALLRKREEFIQAKRKLLVDHPQPPADAPKFELYGSLLLTAEEIADLGKRTISFGSPRAAAQEHIVAGAAAGAVATPVYKETLFDPEDADLAAVAYTVASYRGKKVADTPVLIFVHRWRGAWGVLELPGRVNSILIGPPPTDYKRAG